VIVESVMRVALRTERRLPPGSLPLGLRAQSYLSQRVSRANRSGRSSQVSSGEAQYPQSPPRARGCGLFGAYSLHRAS
jgi:hypothetical protein